MDYNCNLHFNLIHKHILSFKGTTSDCPLQTSLFVSPELSSGRDLVIQMSVRRPPSAVYGFLSRAYLGNRTTYLDDIWCVGGARSEVAHAEFWVWQMPIKYLICIIYAKIYPEHFSGTVCPTWMIFGMWVGLGRRHRLIKTQIGHARDFTWYRGQRPSPARVILSHERVQIHARENLCSYATNPPDIRVRELLLCDI